MKIHRNPLLMTAFFAICFLQSAHADGAIRIVIDANQPDPKLTEVQVANLVRSAYQGMPATWPNGAELHPIDRAGLSNNVREKFYRTLFNRNLTQMRALWSQLVFTGRGEAPLSASDFTELKQKLGARAGAVSFVSSDEPLQGLRVIATVNP